jgi:hypothetical protein
MVRLPLLYAFAAHATNDSSAAADRKLLLGILKLQNVAIDNEAMAKYMSTDDVTVTAGSIQNRVKRLKAMAKEDGGDGYVSKVPNQLTVA